MSLRRSINQIEVLYISQNVTVYISVRLMDPRSGLYNIYVHHKLQVREGHDCKVSRVLISTLQQHTEV